MIIKDVLREELKNSLHMKELYEAEIAELPKGSLLPRRIKGLVYYYLVYRDCAGKVKTEYRGKANKTEIEKYKKAVETRKLYRQLIRDLNKQIKYLEKILRGKEDV